MTLENEHEVKGFVKSIFMLEDPCDDDRYIEIEVIKNDTNFLVKILFTYEIDSDGEHKRTDTWFKWFKHESVEKLDRYVHEAIDEINEQDINYKK
jgi:hypothetical protein